MKAVSGITPGSLSEVPPHNRGQHPECACIKEKKDPIAKPSRFGQTETIHGTIAPSTFGLRDGLSVVWEYVRDEWPARAAPETSLKANLPRGGRRLRQSCCIPFFSWRTWRFRPPMHAATSAASKDSPRTDASSRGNAHSLEGEHSKFPELQLSGQERFGILPSAKYAVPICPPYAGSP